MQPAKAPKSARTQEVGAEVHTAQGPGKIVHFRETGAV